MANGNTVTEETEKRNFALQFDLNQREINTQTY